MICVHDIDRKSFGCVKKYPILLFIIGKIRKSIPRRQNSNIISNKHQRRMTNMVHGAQSLKTRTTSSICIYANVSFNRIYLLYTMSWLMNSRVNLVKRAFEFLLFQIFPAKVFEVKIIRMLVIISRIS